MGYLKCLYMQPRVGETFDATITSALEFGLFVQLKEMPIDGLVHISAIPGDYWELESGGMGLVGQRTRQTLADGRRRARAPEPGRSHAAPNRFRIARCGAAPPATARCVRRGAARAASAGAAAARRRPRRGSGGGGAQRGGARRARRARLGAAGVADRSATSSMACMPSTRCSNGRPSGCWNSGWRSRATTRALAD